MSLGGSGMSGMVMMGCMGQWQQVGLLLEAGMIDRQVEGPVYSLLWVLRLWNSHNTEIPESFWSLLRSLIYFDLQSLICWDLKVILPVYRTSVRQVVVFRVTEAQYSSKHVIYSSVLPVNQLWNIKARIKKTEQNKVLSALYLEAPLKWEILLTLSSLSLDTDVLNETWFHT